jgi:hypothetical protein
VVWSLIKGVLLLVKLEILPRSKSNVQRPLFNVRLPTLDYPPAPRSTCMISAAFSKTNNNTTSPAAAAHSSTPR